MDIEKTDEHLYEVLVEHWRLPASTVPTEAALLTALSARVQDLMLHRPHKLTTAMYTLDISEEKFAQSLALPDIESQAEAIAQLIIVREVQKVESWRRYQEQKENQPREIPEDSDAG
jgi:hypothetical protein